MKYGVEQRRYGIFHASFPFLSTLSCLLVISTHAICMRLFTICYNTNMSVIDDYLETIIPSHRTELERVRSIIKASIPDLKDTEEVISYGLPTINYKGKHLVHFSSFKDHLSLFPGALSKDLKDKVQDYKTSKGTIQFTVDHPLPDALIQEIVRSRLAAVDADGK